MTATVLKRRCAIYTRKSTDEGLDMAFNSLDAQREACEAVCGQPARRRLGPGGRPLRRRRPLRRQPRKTRSEAPAGRHPGRQGGLRGRLQDRSPDPGPDGLLEAGRSFRQARRDLRLRHPELQHHQLHGSADAQHPAVLRAVRARAGVGARAGQDRRLQAARPVDRRRRAAGLQGCEPPADHRPGRGRRSSGGSSSGS